MVLGWYWMVLVWYLMVAVGADGRGCWTGGCFFERQRIPADEYGARVSGSYSRKAGPNATPAQSGEERFPPGGIPGPQNRELCLCVCGVPFYTIFQFKVPPPPTQIHPSLLSIMSALYVLLASNRRSSSSTVWFCFVTSREHAPSRRARARTRTDPPGPGGGGKPVGVRKTW